LNPVAEADCYSTADFIAHARTDIPALLDLVSQLRQENRDLELALYTIANQRRRDDLVDQALRRPLLKAATKEVSRLRDQLADAAGMNQANCARANRAELHADGLRRRAEAAEGVVARITELHQPEKRYHDGSAEFSFEDPGDLASELGVEPEEVPFFEICSHCAEIEERLAGPSFDYLEALWPCATMRAVLAVPTNTPEEQTNV